MDQLSASHQATQTGSDVLSQLPCLAACETLKAQGRDDVLFVMPDRDPDRQMPDVHEINKQHPSACGSHHICTRGHAPCCSPASSKALAYLYSNLDEATAIKRSQAACWTVRTYVFLGLRIACNKPAVSSGPRSFSEPACASLEH